MSTLPERIEAVRRFSRFYTSRIGLLDAASREQIRALIGHLATEDQDRLTDAMRTVERLISDEPRETAPYLLRDPHPGDLGWIVEVHGRLYAREYGWDERFEGTAAEIVARYARERDPRRERCWIAERRGRNVGCVMVLAHAPEVAQLRCLVVDPSARGLGIGRRLVQECLRFAGDAGYRRMMLWTVDLLHAARRIYASEGFELTSEEPWNGFGPELVAQTWERAL